MYKNYLKIAWRNLLKNPGYSGINILGLAVGISCFLLISMFVKNEFSYDRFHTKSGRIYRVWQHESYGPKEDFVNTFTPVSMARVLEEQVPEIEAASRVYRFNAMIRKTGEEFSEAVHAVDPGFFELFDFGKAGGRHTALFQDPRAMILTASAAVKYFGTTEATGKTLEMDFNGEFQSFTIAAVLPDPPEESSIRFDMLVSLTDDSRFFGERARRNWYNVVVESYVLLAPGQDYLQVETKLPAVVRQYLGSNYEEGTFMLHLQPLEEIHLDSSLPAGLEPVSDPMYSYIMGSISLLVLLLACINYVTLAVGRSFSRALEVGVRKAMGAFRKQIVFQFWGESVIITIFAVCLGIGLSLIFLKPFNDLTGKSLTFSFDMLFWVSCLGLMAFVALVSGMYPSLVLSRFNPVEVLRRKRNNPSAMGSLGRVLVIAQFVVALVMVSSTLIIGRQLQYLTHKDLGYQKDALIVIPTHRPGEEGQAIAKRFIGALEARPEVAAACFSTFSFMENSWYDLGLVTSTNTYREFAFNTVGSDFLKTHGIRLKSGRDFEPGNKQHGALVNETFVREFGLADPVGKPFDRLGITILGVVEDFHFQPLVQSIRPLMLAMDPDPVLRQIDNIETQYVSQPRITVRMQGTDPVRDVALLRDTWERMYPSQEFDYTFLDASLASQYRNEQRTKTVVNIAAILSLFIACLGLLGLATLQVARRTSEIGIRKVLGANVWNILTLITIDFMRLVFIGAVLAFPISWFAMRQWLQDYAYHISIGLDPFLWTLLLVLGVTFLTTGYQSLRAALMNPVKSLRTE